MSGEDLFKSLDQSKKPWKTVNMGEAEDSEQGLSTSTLTLNFPPATSGFSLPAAALPSRSYNPQSCSFKQHLPCKSFLVQRLAEVMLKKAHATLNPDGQGEQSNIAVEPSLDIILY